MKKIILDNDIKRELAKAFKVSHPTVWSALTYKTNSGMARVLRAAAIERGGVIVNTDDKTAANIKFTTHWNEVPHQMVQTFSDRVRMVCNIKGDEGVVIEVDGAVKHQFKDVLLNELHLIQAKAQQIVNDLNS